MHAQQSADAAADEASSLDHEFWERFLVLLAKPRNDVTLVIAF